MELRRRLSPLREEALKREQDCRRRACVDQIRSLRTALSARPNTKTSEQVKSQMRKLIEKADNKEAMDLRDTLMKALDAHRQTQSKLTAADKELAKRKDLVDELQAEHDKASNEQRETKSKLTAMDEELDERNAVIDNLLAELGGARSEVVHLQSVKAELDILKTALTTSANEKHVVQRELACTEQRLVASQREVSRRRVTTSRLRERNSDLVRSYRTAVKVAVQTRATRERATTRFYRSRRSAWQIATSLRRQVRLARWLNATLAQGFQRRGQTLVSTNGNLAELRDQCTGLNVVLYALQIHAGRQTALIATQRRNLVDAKSTITYLHGLSTFFSLISTYLQIALHLSEQSNRAFYGLLAFAAIQFQRLLRIATLERATVEALAADKAGLLAILSAATVPIQKQTMLTAIKRRELDNRQRESEANGIKIEQLEGELTKLRLDDQSARDKIDKLEENIEIANAKTETLSDELRVSRSSNDTAAQTINDLENELEDSRSSNETAAQTIDDLESELDVAKSGKDSAASTLDDVRVELSNAKDNVDRLEYNLGGYRSSWDELAKKCQKLQKKLKKAEDERERCLSELWEERGEVDELELLLQAAKEDAERAQTEFDDVLIANEILFEAHSGHIAKLRKSVKSLEGRLASQHIYFANSIALQGELYARTHERMKHQLQSTKFGSLISLIKRLMNEVAVEYESDKTSQLQALRAKHTVFINDLTHKLKNSVHTIIKNNNDQADANLLALHSEHIATLKAIEQNVHLFVRQSNERHENEKATAVKDLEKRHVTMLRTLQEKVASVMTAKCEEETKRATEERDRLLKLEEMVKMRVNELTAENNALAAERDKIQSDYEEAEQRELARATETRDMLLVLERGILEREERRTLT